MEQEGQTREHGKGPREWPRDLKLKAQDFGQTEEVRGHPQVSVSTLSIPGCSCCMARGIALHLSEPLAPLLPSGNHRDSYEGLNLPDTQTGHSVSDNKSKS